MRTVYNGGRFAPWAPSIKFVPSRADITLLGELLSPTAQNVNAMPDRFFEASAEFLAVLDFDGRFRRTNPACRLGLEYTADELSRMTAAEMVHPDDRALWEEGMRRVSQGEPHQGLEIRLATRAGRWVWVSWTIAPPSAGEYVLYAAGRDVTDQRRIADELKRAKELAERHADELVLANRELEEFAHAASHDLQEPVRNLVSYSTLLAEDLGDDLPSDAAEDLRYIIASAKRMQRLVQDLLALSRAGRKELKVEPVDLEECVSESLEALRQRILDSGASYVQEPLPTVRGDERLLTQLFQNILGNAMKFTRDDVPPRIRVRAKRQQAHWLIEIEDNGIGLEQRYADQIFAPFRRLHGMERYEGAGVGLAICRKAVERHGGKIWVESEPGVGSCFKFTLPATDRE